MGQGYRAPAPPRPPCWCVGLRTVGVLCLLVRVALGTARHSRHGSTHHASHRGTRRSSSGHHVAHRPKARRRRGGSSARDAFMRGLFHVGSRHGHHAGGAKKRSRHPTGPQAKTHLHIRHPHIHTVHMHSSHGSIGNRHGSSHQGSKKTSCERTNKQTAPAYADSFVFRGGGFRGVSNTSYVGAAGPGGEGRYASLGRLERVV